MSLAEDDNSLPQGGNATSVAFPSVSGSRHSRDCTPWPMSIQVPTSRPWLVIVTGTD